MSGERPVTPLAGRAVKGAAWMIAWRMATRILGLGSTLLLAHILVPADFGLVAMAMVLAGAIDSIALIGLQDALIRRASHDRALFDPAFAMQIIRGFVTAGLMAAAAWPASLWFGEPRLFVVILVLAGATALAGFENIAIVEFRRAMRFDREFRLLLLPRLAQVVLTVALALIWRNYWALVAGIVFGKAARVAMTYAVHPHRPRFVLHRWRELIHFSFWTWMSGMASMIWERSDAFIVGPVLGSATFGAYVLAEEMAILPVTELIAPAVAALYAAIALKRREGGATFTMAFPLVAFLLMLITPLAIGISASSGYWVHGLLGPKWAAAQPLVSIFALASITACVSYVCTTILIAEGHVRDNFAVVAISAAVKITLLAAVTTVTHRPEIIAGVSISTNVLEALLFTIRISRLGGVFGRAALGGIARTVIASATTLAALHATGLAWVMPPTMPGSTTLLTGLFVAAAAAILFGTVQLGLWRLAGQPAGPETRALETFGSMIARYRVRLRQTIGQTIGQSLGRKGE